MKVMALNSSPRGGGQSKTEWMLDNLIEGMCSAGAEVDKIDLRKKKINYCIGCFTCWSKTPGVCVHNDDMARELFQQFIESELVVFATPLYHYTVNAQIKTFIERTLPILEPFIIKKENGRSGHPLRHEHPDAVWLSVAGFSEMSVFDQLSQYVNFIYKKRLLAEIYRPAAETMMQTGNDTVRAQIAQAVQAAGIEIIQTGKVAAETIAAIQQPLRTSEQEGFGGLGNLFWQTCIDAGVTPREFEEKGMIPRPDSLDSFLAILSLGFNPEGAGDTRAVIQFVFSGVVSGNCFLSINKGTIKTETGLHANPDVSIQAPFELWMDIMTGKADGQTMFMQQKYIVEGDLELLLRMNQLFGR